MNIHSGNLFETFTQLNKKGETSYEEFIFIRNFPNWFGNLEESSDKQKMRDIMLAEVFNFVMWKKYLRQ